MTIPGSSLLMDDNGASCLPCTPEEESTIIANLSKSSDSKCEGELVYVLCNSWFMEWMRYTGNDGDEEDDDDDDFLYDDELPSTSSSSQRHRPGPINNYHLLAIPRECDDDCDPLDLELAPSLEENRDYTLVSPQVWKQLHEWYRGGPALPRKIIPRSFCECVAEVYPLRLQLIDARDSKEYVVRLSKRASVRQLYNKVSTLLELDEEKVQIWDYSNKRKGSELHVSDSILEDVNIQMDQEILLEVKFDDLWLSCTPEEEEQTITELRKAAESNPKEGELYYVLSYRWYMKWMKYVGKYGDGFSVSKDSTSSQVSDRVLSNARQRPGPIDNSHLVLGGSDCKGEELELITPLGEDQDYTLVPEEVWKKFHHWYKGGPALPRKLISQGFKQALLVEVYPLRLQLIDARDKKQYIVRLSKKASLHQLYDTVSILLDLDMDKVRIWDFFNKEKSSLLSPSLYKTLEDAHMQMDQDILLEVKLDDHCSSGVDSTGNGLAVVPSGSCVTIAGGPALSSGYGYSTGYASNAYRQNNLISSFIDVDNGHCNMNKVTKADDGGLAGLQNLGNTCFMNSAIQCLVHTPPLVEYFLQDYTDEINQENPIGMHGELAIAFGELLRNLWSSGRAPIAPRAFKGKLARFAPQFSGYNQHDSQELLAFLLDGLHEDLNRVKSKPYIELKDANGRPDEELADECWEIHKARNDSVIVDVCQGQYKSTLVCPECGKISVTFDPFMYLSLPLPSTVTRSMTITVFYGDGSALPIPFTVKVLKNGCYRDLLQALSLECCLKDHESLLLAEVYDHKIFKYLNNPYELLSEIKDNDHIVAYRLPKEHERLTKLGIIHRSKEQCTSEGKKLLGAPLITCLVGEKQTGPGIQKAMHMLLNPLLKTKASHSVYSKENGSATSINDNGMIKSCSADSGVMEQSIDNMDIEQMSDGTMPFQLSLTDEKGYSHTPIENDFVSQGHHIWVSLDWSDVEHDMYDIGYLEDLPVVHKTGLSLKKTRAEAISLFSCLEAFMKEEPLGPDDMWYCPSCKEHRQATKKLDLWKLPEILVVHLKRFSYSRYFKNKLDTFVSFPIHGLDLSKYVKSKAGDAPQSHIYELYAISNHYGGLGGGHYSAYAKLIEADRWYNFDDSHVSPVSEDDIKTSAAYVLFYRRVKENGGIGGSSQAQPPSSS